MYDINRKFSYQTGKLGNGNENVTKQGLTCLFPPFSCLCLFLHGKPYLWMYRVLLPCIISNNTGIFKHRDGLSNGNGQRKRSYGTCWEAKQQSKVIVLDLKGTSPIAARGIQQLLTYCLELLITSRLQIAAKVEFLTPGCKIQLLQWAHFSSPLVQPEPRIKLSDCQRTLP